MERAVKERLVGASLLILAAVIIVPWLLDGPEQKPSETTQLQLPGSGTGQTETRTIVLDGTVPGGSGVSRSGSSVTEMTRDPVQNSQMNTSEDAANSNPKEADAIEGPSSPLAATSAPVMATGASPSDPSPTRPEPPPAVFTQPVQAAEEPDPVAIGKPAATVTTGTEWAVQVGSFAQQKNAERLADRLKSKDYGAFVMRNVVDGRVRYRVRVGPMKERGEADELAAALRADRQPARVVTHP